MSDEGSTQQVVEEMELEEVGEAEAGDSPEEVVIALSPAFGEEQLNRQTIHKLPHAAVLRELLAGIEEEGLEARLVRVYRTADVAFMGFDGAQLSGSGISIGIQARGTALIHQRELLPLAPLELFPQAPGLDLDNYRQIGKNAAQYAKGDSPSPVPQENDPMARPKWQAIASVFYIREVEFVDQDRKPVELKVSFEK
jgi:propanediol dehydratase medium subunit